MKTYFIYRNGQQEGPFDVSTILSMHLGSDTFVWCEGMSDWQPITSVPELQQQPQAPAYQPYGAPPQPSYSQQPQQPQQYSQAYSQSEQIAPPPSHMALAIITTIFCCLPLGIYAIILANKVDTLYMTGHYEDAQKASDDAKKWSLIGMIGSLILSVLYIIAIFAFGLSLS